ncbi:MAG: domain family protein [Proteobacteria bacterium]|nr:domain family protein [Pseudomonadota bacterium]
MPSLGRLNAAQAAHLLALLPLRQNTSLRGRFAATLSAAAEGRPQSGSGSRLGSTPATQDPQSVWLVNPAALLQRLQTEMARDRSGLVEQLKQLAQPKVLRVPDSAHWAQLLELYQRMPHLAAVLDPLLNRIKLQIATQHPLKLSPTLLTGAPGNGKSHLLHQLAEVFNVPTLELQLGGNADNLALVGTSRHWGSASPGKLALFLAQSPVANPLILLEEIDKSGIGQHGWTLDIVLLLLEPENACEFEDKFVEVPIDLSHCSFLATANSSAQLPAPLLSRFQTCLVSAPPPEAWSIILNNLYAHLLLQEGRAQLFHSTLPQELQAEFLAQCPSIRELRKRLEQGFDAALACFDSPEALLRQKGELLPEAPETQASETQKRMGFF